MTKPSSLELAEALPHPFRRNTPEDTLLSSPAPESPALGTELANPYRRRLLTQMGCAAATAALPRFAFAATPGEIEAGLRSRRPAPADRKFTSQAVEATIVSTQKKMADPLLAAIFANCFPNTLDTTVKPGTFEGKPDTAVITGDIDAMWLRDSSAQVWPYLQLIAHDAPLKTLIEGVIRRQTRCLLIDTYANSFMADLSAPPLEWSRADVTDMKQGVGERKYELDSICYPIRLAHGYWKATGDTAPFDFAWKQAMQRVIETMQVQQLKHGPSPYHFSRASANPTDTLVNGMGNPAKPNGLIASCFRPSDDACILPFFIPANLFAVTSLRQLAEMLAKISHDTALANTASALAEEVSAVLRQHAIVDTPQGSIWAYEVDGFGARILMDDANAPGLLSLPYLDSSPDPALYARTRAFVWSSANPWFFSGKAGEGIGGPHIGRDSIWPMSQIVHALTSNSDVEITRMIAMLKSAAAATGFMHESYNKDDSATFTRAWFAWANTLFGELIVKTAQQRPNLLR